MILSHRGVNIGIVLEKGKKTYQYYQLKDYKNKIYCELNLYLKDCIITFM